MPRNLLTSVISEVLRWKCNRTVKYDSFKANDSFSQWKNLPRNTWSNLVVWLFLSMRNYLRCHVSKRRALFSLAKSNQSSSVWIGRVVFCQNVPVTNGNNVQKYQCQSKSRWHEWCCFNDCGSSSPPFIFPSFSHSLLHRRWGIFAQLSLSHMWCLWSLRPSSVWEKPGKTLKSSQAKMIRALLNPSR